jgi:hypothetical protein
MANRFGPFGFDGAAPMKILIALLIALGATLPLYLTMWYLALKPLPRQLWPRILAQGHAIAALVWLAVLGIAFWPFAGMRAWFMPFWERGMPRLVCAWLMLSWLFGVWLCVRRKQAIRQQQSPAVAE